MTEMIAFCGLVCSKCPAFLATKQNSDALRKEMSERLEKHYGLKYKPEKINCDGCHTDGDTILKFCRDCEVRLCGKGKKLETCVECADQPCDKLTRFHSFSPAAKAAYESLL